jgi:hypothetical protein
LLGYALDFMNDLASRLSHRVQLTTDGHHAYLVAVQEPLGHQIDWAQLVKLYGPKKGGAERRTRAQVQPRAVYWGQDRQDHRESRAGGR